MSKSIGLGMFYGESQLKVLRQIGQYYLEKNDNDYDKCAEDIKKVGFSEVIPTGDIVVVKCARVGWFIGKRGENLDKLSKYLDKKIHVIEINTIEDLIIPYPVLYSYYSNAMDEINKSYENLRDYNPPSD